MSLISSENIPTPRAVHGISEQQRRDMMNFLQGSVYCWCKNRKGEPFAARDLLGGDNYYWQDTPMMALYEYYLDGNDDNHDSIKVQELEKDKRNEIIISCLELGTGLRQLSRLTGVTYGVINRINKKR